MLLRTALRSGRGVSERTAKSAISLPLRSAPLTARHNMAAAAVSPLIQSPFTRAASAMASPTTHKSSPSTSSSSHLAAGAHGNTYIVTSEQINDFHKNGYIHLKNFLTEEELKPLEDIYMKFMNRIITVPGKDMCDMSGNFDKPFEEYSIINAMLPRKYYPPLINNIYEQRARAVVHQLFRSKNQNEFELDYDQLLAKKPQKTDAVFAWHQDMSYWPGTNITPDTRTATFSLAIDPTTKQNGCLRFVDGSHTDQSIRLHKPINEDRDKAHAIACTVDEQNEPVKYVQVGRGDVTVHNEYVVHGSGGNHTQTWRRTYVVAFRPTETVKIERAAGFTHSHNDTVNWDTFNEWQKK